jgi:hypothetical protein
MKKILLELSDELNQELKIYTAKNSFKNLKEASVNILEKELLKDIVRRKKDKQNEKS